MKLIFFLLTLFALSSTGQTVTISVWKDSVIGAIYNKTTASVAYGKKMPKAITKFSFLIRWAIMKLH